MDQMDEIDSTKTLIVTETLRSKFELRASLPEDEASLSRFFCGQADPWAAADFCAVTERDFDIQLVVDGSKPIEPDLHRR